MQAEYKELMTQKCKYKSIVKNNPIKKTAKGYK